MSGVIDLPLVMLQKAQNAAEAAAASAKLLEFRGRPSADLD